MLRSGLGSAVTLRASSSPERTMQLFVACCPHINIHVFSLNLAHMMKWGRGEELVYISNSEASTASQLQMEPVSMSQNVIYMDIPTYTQKRWIANRRCMCQLYVSVKVSNSVHESQRTRLTPSDLCPFTELRRSAPWTRPQAHSPLCVCVGVCVHGGEVRKGHCSPSVVSVCLSCFTKNRRFKGSQGITEGRGRVKSGSKRLRIRHRIWRSGGMDQALSTVLNQKKDGQKVKGHST